MVKKLWGPRMLDHRTRSRAWLLLRWATLCPLSLVGVRSACHPTLQEWARCQATRQGLTPFWSTWVQLDLEAWLKRFGTRHVGGGPVAGLVEMDCLLCHTPVDDQAARAAALAESGKPFHREAYLAQLLCAEKAMEIGTNAVQLLGGLLRHEGDC